MPEITVLMPVRNGEKYIKDAINSVLRQTLTDFELLIIDDGSIDRTVEIIQGYTDQRIRLEKREHQFIPNLNEGIKLASAPYIARMDADDIMHTERLRIQLKRMKKIRIS
ncbi:glycosyltransferase family 2 protein [Bacteroides thetaiotaomicron]|nr:glycosyltransferase family 2 protein [Bacteroides thetaiotaomicron]